MDEAMIRYRISQIKNLMEYLTNAILTSSVRNMITDANILMLQAEEELKKLYK